MPKSNKQQLQQQGEGIIDTVKNLYQKAKNLNQKLKDTKIISSGLKKGAQIVSYIPHPKAQIIGSTLQNFGEKASENGYGIQKPMKKKGKGKKQKKQK